MANLEYVLYEEYASKLNGESSRAVANPVIGGLYLVDEGILFDPGNTFLAASGNLWEFMEAKKVSPLLLRISQKRKRAALSICGEPYTLFEFIQKAEKLITF